MQPLVYSYGFWLEKIHVMVKWMEGIYLKEADTWTISPPSDSSCCWKKYSVKDKLTRGATMI